jgi:hypothetical protein
VPEPAIDLRPRSTGEVLDDAWRLALADLPVLLALNALFLVPAFAALLLLLGRPAHTGLAGLLWPALTATLVALSGLGSGACQEWLQRRLEGAPDRALRCLGGALRRGLEHAAARAVVVPGVLVGLALFLLPGLSLWAFTAPVHAIIAQSARGKLLSELRRESGAAAVQAAGVTLVRLPLLLLAAINFHILLHAGLWAAEAFAGLETALLAAGLGLFANPVYTAVLFLTCWLLLSPFFEACNFLLHLDTRTRREGSDLFYRIQRAFPPAENSRPVSETSTARQAVALLLALAASLLAAGKATAAEDERDAVQAARTRVAAVREEVKAVDPYPGGGKWEPRLLGLADRLEHFGGPTRYGWFRKALIGFSRRDRGGALRVLGGLERRLELVEDSLSLRPRTPDGKPVGPEDVKGLLRGERPREGTDRSTPEKKSKDEIEKKEKHDPVEDDRLPRGGRGGGRSAPLAGGGGFGSFGWAVLAGLAVAVLATAGYFFFTNMRRDRPAKPATPAAEKAPAEEAPQPGTTTAAQLWARAEAAAAAGNYPEGVRLLHLAVLFELDRRGLLVYETTRTNGEYVRQVRLAERAPEGMHGPFEDLTRRFEETWYGGRPCAADEFGEFRRQAEDVRDRASEA